MPTTGHTLAPHARLLAKSSKLKASSNQFLTGPGSKEQFPLRFPAPKFQIGMLDEPSHDARMKVATIIARVLLGLIFVVFGSNIFLHFIPMPPPPSGLLGDFTKALFLSHYLHVVRSKEQFPLRFPAPKFQIGMLDEPSHDARMKVATIIARVLLGLIFVVFGSNIFLHFIPMPPPPSGLLGDFTKALFLSHYLHVV